MGRARWFALLLGLAALAPGCEDEPGGAGQVGRLDCADDAECDADQRCEAGACVDVGDEGCGGGPACGAGTSCVDGECVDDEGPPPECEDGQTRCEPSGEALFCGEGRWQPCPPDGECWETVCRPRPTDLAVKLAMVEPLQVRPGDVVRVSGELSWVSTRLAGWSAQCRVALITPNSSSLVSEASLPRVDLLDGFVEPFEGELVVPEYDGDLFVLVECDAAAGEEDLANNISVYERPLQIRPLDTGFDLFLTVARQLTPVAPDGSVDFVVQVCNSGGTPTPPWEIAVWQGEFPVGRGRGPALAPTACENLDVAVTGLFCEDEAFTALRFEVVAPGDVDPLNDAMVVELPCPSCVGDRFDPADADSPPTIRADEPGLSLCAGDIDRFVLDAVATDGVHVEVESTGALPDLRLLGESGGERVPLTSGVETNLGWFSGPLPWAERYVLEVTSLEPIGYDLHVAPFPLVPGVDLAVVGLDVSATVDTRAGVLEVGYMIEHRGRVAAEGVSAVEVAIHLARPGLSGRAWLGSFEHPMPSPGSRAGYTRQVPLNGLLTPGPVQLIVTVDPEHRVAETDERNDAATASIEVTGAPARCADALEPNDRRELPARLEEGTVAELALCEPASPDFYRVCLEAEQSATLVARSAGPEASVDLWLYDELGTVLTTDEGPGTTATLAIPTVPDRRCFTAEVRRDEPFVASVVALYDLELTLGGVDPCGDVYEPNDSFGTATWIEDVGPWPTRLCPDSDVDLFFADLTAPDTVTFEVAADAPVDVTLYGPDQTFLATRRGSSVALPWTADADGIHTMRVGAAEGGAPVAYTIRVVR